MQFLFGPLFPQTVNVVAYGYCVQITKYVYIILISNFSLCSTALNICVYYSVNCFAIGPCL